MLVCSAVINTPMLLMRSGYGSRELLGDKLLVENPNVGNHYNTDQTIAVRAFSDKPLMEAARGTNNGDYIFEYGMPDGTLSYSSDPRMVKRFEEGVEICRALLKGMGVKRISDVRGLDERVRTYRGNVHAIGSGLFINYLPQRLDHPSGPRCATRKRVPPTSLVPRFIDMVLFVASATASSSRSDDDAMSTCIVEEERQRNRCRPAATLRADGGCGRPLCRSSSPMSLHRLLLAP